MLEFRVEEYSSNTVVCGRGRLDGKVEVFGMSERRVVERLAVQIVSLALEAYERALERALVAVVEHHRVRALIGDLDEHGRSHRVESLRLARRRVGRCRHHVDKRADLVLVESERTAARRRADHGVELDELGAALLARQLAAHRLVHALDLRLAKGALELGAHLRAHDQIRRRRLVVTATATASRRRTAAIAASATTTTTTTTSASAAIAAARRRHRHPLVSSQVRVK